MEKLSVVIITLNEEAHLKRCLDSVSSLADEVLVLDSFSTDGTQAICEAAGVRFEQHAFDGYVSQKNRALSMARNDWVLSLDGDEALSKNATDNIRQVMKNPTADGFEFNRRNSYCGRWMKYTSLYPDRKLRLFNRQKAQWTGYDPHDHVEMNPGSIKQRLRGDLLHWVIKDRAEHAAKTQHFAEIAARAYFRESKNTWFGQGLIHAIWRWNKEYFVRMGYLEGYLGWQFASFSAKYVYLKYRLLKKLYAARNQSNP